MQKQMMQEVETHRPVYLIFVNTWGSWNARPGSPQALALGTWLGQYISNNFEEASTVELAEPELHQSLGEIRVFKRRG